VTIGTAVTVLAFGPSLQHIHDALVRFGQDRPSWLPWATAASVDLLLVAAGLELRRRHRLGIDRRWDALAVLTLAVVATVAAQVVTAQASFGGWVSAVWPAVAFLAIVGLVEGRPEVPPVEVAGRPIDASAAATGGGSADGPLMAAPVPPTEGATRRAIVAHLREGPSTAAAAARAAGVSPATARGHLSKVAVQGRGKDKTWRLRPSLVQDDQQREAVR
jgi:DNA-binding transcriptional ArsR family regulator